MRRQKSKGNVKVINEELGLGSFVSWGGALGRWEEGPAGDKDLRSGGEGEDYVEERVGRGQRMAWRSLGGRERSSKERGRKRERLEGVK